MKNRIAKSTGILILCCLLSFVACKHQPEEVVLEEELSPILMVQVKQHLLEDIRLGDGVPLNLDVSIRWRVTDEDNFTQQFNSINAFNELILRPRALELSKMVSNEFTSIDSVFSTQRNDYIDAIKGSLEEGLGEPGISINEIILADVGFPPSYTQAMEQASLKQRELERIRLQNIVDIEQSAADKLKAEAQSKVAIAQAEANGRLQKINAKMEENRRKSELAKAETQTQVEKLKVAAEAEKRKLMARAELEKQQDLKDLEIQRQRELNQLVIEKQREMDHSIISKESRLAAICSEHPTYASYMVDKQLASKVEVAFLPTGTDPNIFTNLIKNRLPLPGIRE